MAATASSIRDRLQAGKRLVVYFPELAEISESVTAGIMLSQALYWTERSRDGWFYKNRAEWQHETNLTRREQDTAREKLRAKGFLREAWRGRLYFRVDCETVVAALTLGGKCPAVASEGGRKASSEVGAKRPSKWRNPPIEVAESAQLSFKPTIAHAKPTAELLAPTNGAGQEEFRRQPSPKKKGAASDPRYMQTKEFLHAAFREVCSQRETPPWDGHAAKELTQWLASHTLSLNEILQLVRNLMASEGAQQELRYPAGVIRKLRKYHVPLNKFGHPEGEAGGNGRLSLSEQARRSVEGAARLFAAKAPELERAFGSNVCSSRKAGA